MYKKSCKIFKNPFDIPSFHLIVLGSSLEGLACAKVAANLGLKVCVISNGDTFENFQIVLFLEFLQKSIRSAYEAEMANCYSWACNINPKEEFDWKNLMQRIKCAIPLNLQEKLDYFFDSKVTYVEGNVEFVDKYQIAFKEDKEFKIYWADNFVIAPSGCTIHDRGFPDIKDAELYGVTLLDLMELNDLQGEILVIGDGRHALELTSLLNSLLSTTLMCRGNGTDTYDEEMVIKYIEDNNFYILPKCIPNKIERTKSGRYLIHFTQIGKGWRSLGVYDKIIILPTQRVNLKKFSLAKAGINATNYKISTDKNFQTNIKNIFAIGTASENPFDVHHMPYQSGRNLANFIFEKIGCVIDIFDEVGYLLGKPSYCFVGLTEDDAIKTYGAKKIDVYHAIFKSIDAIECTPSRLLNYMKVICINDEEKRILGMHYLGRHTAVVMQGYVAALRCGNLNMDFLRDHPGVFPTHAREFTELKITKRSNLKFDFFSCCS